MIRPAKDADARDIRALWNLAIRDTLITFNSVEKSLDEVRGAIHDYDAFVVAESDGVVLGYAAFGPFRAGAGYAHTKEHSIMLAPDARGRGIGRALMRALEDEGRAQGVHSLIASVSGSNPDSTAFHVALGFAQVGIVPEAGRKFGRWHDLILMQKRL
ncbi:GNAT family N-acetyltransferase [uncultured Aliiroseovarius sp.]|uniref:GNAT family N-acetyltransferase n=1 Tax=uncultured Aliiroseovarius sp. TaxID=1658783 RepID=UPI00260E8FBF|nr:GNAT family N-acetyltransferase [uncultured Aliiroseovarius sp.]